VSKFSSGLDSELSLDVDGKSDSSQIEKFDGVEIRSTQRPESTDTVEKPFRGVRAERLIRQQTEWGNNDSNAAPSSFDYCGNVIFEPRSPTFFNAIDPNQPFKPDAANVRFRIAEPTLLARRSLCAAAIGWFVCFLMHKQSFGAVSREVSV
jgi:hypothetical protein